MVFEKWAQSEAFRASRSLFCGSGIAHIKTDPVHGISFLLAEGLHDRLDGLASAAPRCINFNEDRFALE